jgi:hypothetical protein
MIYISGFIFAVDYCCFWFLRLAFLWQLFGLYAPTSDFFLTLLRSRTGEVSVKRLLRTHTSLEK